MLVMLPDALSALSGVSCICHCTIKLAKSLATLPYDVRDADSEWKRGEKHLSKRKEGGQVKDDGQRRQRQRKPAPKVRPSLTAT